MSNRPRILVTGISGFVGSHVAQQLLEADYLVRGTARGAKVGLLRSAAGVKYPNLEVVQVDDISSADLSDVLKGVNAVIHVASPLSGSNSADVVVKSAIDGTVNVLRQAVKNNVKRLSLQAVPLRFRIVSVETHDTWAGVTWTYKNWGNASVEEATREGQNPFYTYTSSKILAESEAWKFVRAHSTEIDLATIISPYIYGPYLPHFLVRSGSGTNAFVDALITGPTGRVPALTPYPHFVDVRDVARAHVAALSVPKVGPGADPEEKRFLITGGHFTWQEAAEHLRR